MQKAKKGFLEFMKKLIITIKNIAIKYSEYIYMSLPFIFMDFMTRFFDKKIDFVSIGIPVSTLFTLLWTFLFIGISISFKKKIAKKIYIFFIAISLVFYTVNNIYYSIMDTFFDFSLLGIASEGSSYFFEAIKNAKLWIYLSLIIIILLTIFVLKKFPKTRNNNYKLSIKVFLIFILIHLFLPTLLGPANSDLTWSSWRNVRNIYLTFNDNNKSMRVSGLYEYTARNFYLTYLKEEEEASDDEEVFLDDIFEDDIEHINEYTAKFKDKNLILLQMEGIDSWLLTEDIMPNLYSLTNNSINFKKHFSYYNGGGSTFNSEFVVNTGYITPITYTRNAYTFNKNTFNYSLANLFKVNDYQVNAYHMNTREYYSRGINYKNFGYDNYYGLKDLNYYKDNSYILDRELINNPIFNEKMFNTDKKFVDYIITYSNHMPFSSTSGVCKSLVEEQEIENQTLTEEDCIKLQARETDNMIGMLIKALEEKGLLDDTIIVAYADHYLYTINDDSILAKYKETSNNLINNTPLLIWSKDLEQLNIDKVTSQLNILPTILNLFGLEYHESYYVSRDALDNSYIPIAFFSDKSWYDGNVYVDGGTVSNNGEISKEELDNKNTYVNDLIEKNDLVLKYNYFKDIENPKSNIEDKSSDTDE